MCLKYLPFSHTVCHQTIQTRLLLWFAIINLESLTCFLFIITSSNTPPHFLHFLYLPCSSFASLPLPSPSFPFTHSSPPPTINFFPLSLLSLHLFLSSCPPPLLFISCPPPFPVPFFSYIIYLRAYFRIISSFLPFYTSSLSFFLSFSLSPHLFLPFPSLLFSHHPSLFFLFF